jgi:DNA mismatch repair protein MutS2
MFQIKNILDNCDKYSLVLIDEIGSGTDPQEGAALAAVFWIHLLNLIYFSLPQLISRRLKLML